MQANSHMKGHIKGTRKKMHRTEQTRKCQNLNITDTEAQKKVFVSEK